MRRAALWTVLLAACEGGSISVDDPNDSDRPSGPNEPPTAPTVSISPSTPGSGDDLVANLVFEATDADGDALTYVYAWVVDGAPRPDLTAATVPASATSKGEVWQVFVRADDGRDQGEAGTASVSIGNGAPTVAPAWVTPAPGTLDDLVVVPNAVDPDGDPLTLTYTWYVDGAQTGYAGDTVDDSATNGGQTWRVVVTATDGQGGVGQGEVSATIANKLPVLAGLQVTPNPANLRQALVAGFTASDPDGDAFTTSYAWTTNGTPSAYTGAVIPAGATADGQTWTVTVTLDDRHGGVVSGSASASVVNHAPTLTSLTLGPATPGDSDNLVASYVASDADGETPVPTFTFYRNGAVFRTGPGAQVLAAQTLPGDSWYVTASVSDGFKTSGTLTSNAVTIVDLPPTTPVVRTNPAIPSGCGPLVCELVGMPIDPDGTPVSLSFAWTKNGAAFTATTTTTYTGDTVPEVALTAGSTFTCRVTATSGGKSSSGTATATAPANGLVTETFTTSARAQADVLLMVDDSCSMQPYQSKLATDISALTDELSRAGTDWHVGVVTSDVDSQTATRAGRLVVDAPTALKWVTRSTPSLTAVIQRLTNVGTNGSANEMGLEAVELAVTEPLRSGDNAGFLRGTSALAVLYLTDEDDFSAGTNGAAYAAALKAVRSDLVTHAILGMAGDACAYDTGERYLELLEATDGLASSICDASYRASLETFAGRVTGLQRHLTLTAPAPGGVASVVQISPGGTRTTMTSGWTYDATTNQVVLTATPGSGFRFEVTYAPGCPADEVTDTGVP